MFSPRYANHGSTSEGSFKVLNLVVNIFSPLRSKIYFVKSVVECVEFRYWAKKKFPNIKIIASKYSLLNEVLDKTSTRSKLNFLEFGVAFGETTQFLLDKVKTNFSYKGFDTFEGLPSSWRNLPKGAITAGGKIPQIQDERVRFIKGFVEKTLPGIEISDLDTNIFLFDLDLFSPTLFVYQEIKKHVTSGDVLYFDEAFDSAERLIIENYVLNDFDVDPIGISPFAIAFFVRAKIPHNLNEISIN
jgi:hypothetical protein